MINDAISEIVEPNKSNSRNDEELDEIVEKIINLPLNENDTDKNRDNDDSETFSQKKSISPDSRQDNTAHEVMKYEFKVKHLRPKSAVPLYCRECCQDGHTYKDCPHVNIDVPALPPMTSDFMKKVNDVCNGIMGDLELKPHEFEVRMKVLKDLETYLKMTYKSKLCI